VNVAEAAREVPTPPTQHPADRPLAVLRALFDRLHTAGIRYCHWKSNEHLGPTFTGDTDVDVLFDRRAIGPLTRILNEANFKRFVARPERGYPGIEDYVGFDHATGTLTHLHVHYQLTLGEKFLKGHRLPWEEWYLSTRVLDEEFGIYVADPHLELVALLVRAALKVRARDRWLEYLGTPFVRGGMARELRWLARRVRPERMRDIATTLVGPAAAGLVAAMADGRPTIGQLRALRRRARPSLGEYRLYDDGNAARQMATRELGTVWWKLRNWVAGAPTKSTRTLPQGGVSIALLGVDGAGKSTLTAALASWLSREIAVMTTYGGSGKGSASLPRRLMQGLAAWRRRWTRGASRARPEAPTPATVRREAEPSLARLIWILALARERRRRAREARRARGRGMVVLSDRLPQSQYPGWNDGPRLTAWLTAASRLKRAAARRERESFALVDLTPPDLVFKLRVSPEVAARRKPETPPAQLNSGLELVRRMRFPPTTRVVDLDAEQPLADMVLEAKRAVWEAI
jgi:thymidylate kinase